MLIHGEFCWPAKKVLQLENIYIYLVSGSTWQSDLKSVFLFFHPSFKMLGTPIDTRFLMNTYIKWW